MCHLAILGKSPKLASPSVVSFRNRAAWRVSLSNRKVCLAMMLKKVRLPNTLKKRCRSISPNIMVQVCFNKLSYLFESFGVGLWQIIPNVPRTVQVTATKWTWPDRMMRRKRQRKSRNWISLSWTLMHSQVLESSVSWNSHAIISVDG